MIDSSPSGISRGIPPPVFSKRCRSSAQKLQKRKDPGFLQNLALNNAILFSINPFHHIIFIQYSLRRRRCYSIDYSLFLTNYILLQNIDKFKIERSVLPIKKQPVLCCHTEALQISHYPASQMPERWIYPHAAAYISQPFHPSVLLSLYPE